MASSDGCAIVTASEAEMDMGFYIAVTDRGSAGSTYLYGPFATRGAAKVWLDANRRQFAGRICHVIGQSAFVNPE